MKLLTSLALLTLAFGLSTPVTAQTRTLTEIVAASGGQFDRNSRD